MTEDFVLFAKKNSNARRFETLIQPHIKFLYNVAMKYAGNTSDAEDLVQETIVIALKTIEDVGP